MGKKIVIFGRAGQLGTELVRVLTERGYEVTAFARFQVDVSDSARVENAIGSVMPAAVFNATAYNQVDVAEREPRAAFDGNAIAVRNLAVACRQADAQLIHFSTDYVFDGTGKRPYTEEDPTHPLGAYAVSKLTGELFAQAYLPNALIIRTCGVFGPAGLRTARGNFVETMLRLARRPDPIRVVEDYIASPTYSPELALRSVDLFEQTKGVGGLYHIGGGEAISWFDWARMIFQEAGLSPELHPTNEREHRTLARRPKYSALSNAKIEAAGIAPMPPLRDCLQHYLQIRKSAD
jgi:dTDP-4-dehydrorhamnose reductase